MLREVMQGIASGRKPVVHNNQFPLIAIWESFPYGSNEHFGIARALGQVGEVVPVGRHRKFFSTLLKEGLIDEEGNASEDLKKEVSRKKEMKKILDPETNGGLAPDVAKTWATLMLMGDDDMKAECHNCKSKGIVRRGHTMTKCECGIYFGS